MYNKNDTNTVNNNNNNTNMFTGIYIYILLCVFWKKQPCAQGLGVWYGHQVGPADDHEEVRDPLQQANRHKAAGVLSISSVFTRAQFLHTSGMYLIFVGNENDMSRPVWRGPRSARSSAGEISSAARRSWIRAFSGTTSSTRAMASTISSESSLMTVCRGCICQIPSW